MFWLFFHRSNRLLDCFSIAYGMQSGAVNVFSQHNKIVYGSGRGNYQNDIQRDRQERGVAHKRIESRRERIKFVVRARAKDM